MAILFAMSGLLTAYSGAAAVVLAAIAPDGLAATAPGGAAARQIEATAMLRQLTGAVGFAVAGFALIIAAWHQWYVAGAAKRVAPASALLGMAMQFVWFDAATLMHAVTGTALLVWLAVVGGMLRQGRKWLPT